MNKITSRMTANLLSLLMVLAAAAIAPDNAEAGVTYKKHIRSHLRHHPSEETVAVPAPDSTVEALVMPIRESAGLLTDAELPPYDMSTASQELPGWFFLPAVYDHFSFSDQTPLIGAPEPAGSEAMAWLEEDERLSRTMREMRRQFFFSHPELVPYNQALLPQAPPKFSPVIDPSTFSIEMREMPTVAEAETTVEPTPGRKRHWIRMFNVALQFSQAYISPNWYQGGNNNVNAIAQIFWNVKLNEKYYPKLIFDMTTQYKLGINSAPDDTIRKYNISDDLFQWNAKFGYKAANSWYYSITSVFKTQMFNNYASNSRNMRAAFLSPGELNVGLGMSYSKKTSRVEFGATINPLSYNLKTCINHHMNETAFGIKEGRKTVSQFGSSAEANFKAKLSLNITYSSRLFLFTNYEYMQGDWQNTLAFDINRFLATQIFWNLRYDTSTHRLPDTKWHRFQFKEILSFGLSYKFSTI